MYQSHTFHMCCVTCILHNHLTITFHTFRYAHISCHVSYTHVVSLPITVIYHTSRAYTGYIFTKPHVHTHLHSIHTCFTSAICISQMSHASILYTHHACSHVMLLTYHKHLRITYCMHLHITYRRAQALLVK